MRELPLIVLLLTCALATSACATHGPDVKPTACPQLPPPPPALMQPPATEQAVRAELLEPQPPAMPR